MGAITTLDEVVSVLPTEYPHEVTKSKVIRVLSAWSLQRPAFRIFCQTAFQVEEQNCLVPDISVISSGRIVPGSIGLFQGAPELAIEIVSSELETSLQDKIELYFSHAGKSFWVVYPERRIIRIHDAAGRAKRFRSEEPLVDPNVLPGFTVPTSAIFQGV
jgi:Uma2 family endonuclease